MPAKLIWSGIVTSKNIHDVFLHILDILEGEKFSVKKTTVKSDLDTLSRTDQKFIDSIIKKEKSTKQISIITDNGEVTILQLLNPLNPKKDPKCPYVKISTDKILIENQNRRGIKERVVIIINS